jgi:hypothetical protein
MSMSSGRLSNNLAEEKPVGNGNGSKREEKNNDESIIASASDDGLRRRNKGGNKQKSLCEKKNSSRFVGGWFNYYLTQRPADNPHGKKMNLSKTTHHDSFLTKYFLIKFLLKFLGIPKKWLRWWSLPLTIRLPAKSIWNHWEANNRMAMG